MNQDYTQAPLDPEIGPAAPHLVDYWQVLTRRLWLVLLIFGVTTAAAIWAVSRQKTYYETSLLLQINDPLERSRQLTNPGIRFGTQIFVDPIESEIQVLLSGQVAEKVVDELGLRLRPADDAAIKRSDLAWDIRVDRDAGRGGLELRYDATGSLAELVGSSGEVLGQAAVGDRLEAGSVAFTLQPPPSESRLYPLEIVPHDLVINEVQGFLSGIPRESTNLIDVTYRGEDEWLAPRILDAAARALQDIGANKVRQQAEGALDFTRDQFDSAQAAFAASSQAVRDFQQDADLTNLGAEEQLVLTRMRQFEDDVDRLERQQSALQDLGVALEGSGIVGVDLVAFMAALPTGANPQLSSMVSEIQGRKNELERRLTEDGMTDNHPEVQALRGQISSREGELRSAVDENLRIVGQEIASQDLLLQNAAIQQGLLPELRSQLEELEVTRQTDLETVRFLNSQLYQARILASSAEPYVDIVDPARPAFAVKPRGRTNLILGALLGIILGVGAAFFLEYLDRTVRTSSDVETLLGIPVLGVIPRLRRVVEVGDDGGPATLPLLVAMDPLDPAAEAYRNLRMNLMFMSTDDVPIRVTLFSSPGPHEGKSTSALNFAVMLAQQGQRVLLIDADLRRPSLHKGLDLLREPGLTNLLISDVEPREAIRPNVLPNLDVLPSGPFPPNPAELLNSKTMQRLIEEFEGRYAHVIVDTPPVLAVTDAALIGSVCDGVVLVLRSGETEQRAAERAVDQLRRVGVRVFGAVLNEVSTATTEESYYLQYYYSYHPQESSGWDRLREGLSKARFW